MHRRPGEVWTLEALAGVARISRSRVAERFATVVGMPPAQYLGRWRMHLAAVWLRSERLTVAEVASRLAYESEAAFSRAFKRNAGVPPGALRRGNRAPTPITRSSPNRLQRHDERMPLQRFVEMVGGALMRCTRRRSGCVRIHTCVSSSGGGGAPSTLLSSHAPVIGRHIGALFDAMSEIPLLPACLLGSTLDAQTAA
jgi:AraC-like DNA-binding protein